MQNEPLSSAGEGAPRWLWLWTPPALVAAQVVAKAIDEDLYLDYLRGEHGVVENLTVVVLALATFFAFRCFLWRGRVSSPLFGPFVLIMTIGCFFFAGEETSWGQHWLGYETPDAVAERNDQGEFNLHNDPFLEKLLDQPLRLLLTLAAFVGGVVAPLLRGRRGRTRPELQGSVHGWLWPTIVCLPACVTALVVSLPKKLFRAADRELPYLVDISPGETKEFCLALFLLLYLFTLWRVLRRAPSLAARGDAH